MSEWTRISTYYYVQYMYSNTYSTVCYVSCSCILHLHASTPNYKVKLGYSAAVLYLHTLQLLCIKNSFINLRSGGYLSIWKSSVTDGRTVHNTL